MSNETITLTLEELDRLLNRVIVMVADNRLQVAGCHEGKLNIASRFMVQETGACYQYTIHAVSWEMICHATEDGWDWTKIKLITKVPIK